MASKTPPEIKTTPQPGKVNGWNYRFVCYAKAKGWGETNLDGFLVQEELQYPGGKMAGFSIWITAKWSEFGMEKVGRRETETVRLMLGGEADRLFDAWLGQKYPLTDKAGT